MIMLELIKENWIVFTLLAATSGAICGFVENYMSDVVYKKRYPQANKCFFAVAYTIVGIILIVAGGGTEMNFEAVGLPLIAGAVNAISMIFFEAGLAREESTASRIFAQLSPLSYLILGAIFLGQKIAGVQWLAFFIVLSAPAITLFFGHSKRKKKIDYKSAASFCLYNLLSPVANLILVSVSGKYSFLTSVGLIYIGRGVTDAILVGVKKPWRDQFRRAWRRDKKKLITSHMTRLFTWFVASFVYRVALTGSAVALVSVVYNASDLIITFFLGLMLSIVWPNFGREKLEKRTVIAHLISVAVATVGIILLKS